MLTESITIRRSRKNDIRTLRDLFRSSVSQVAETAYDESQMRSWLQFADDPDFNDFIETNQTYVAVAYEIVGFGGLGSNGHIASLYVHGNWQRKGIGSLLLNRLIDVAKSSNESKIYVEASEFSKPLFEMFGFMLRHVEIVERRGVVFQRYVMELDIRP